MHKKACIFCIKKGSTALTGPILSTSSLPIRQYDVDIGRLQFLTEVACQRELEF